MKLIVSLVATLTKENDGKFFESLISLALLRSF
jgi:hypothetical protein